MKTFVLVRDGVVLEIIPPMQDADGTEIGLADRYAPEFVDCMVDITNMIAAPVQGWTYDGHSFAAPASTQMTPAQLLAASAAAMTVAVQSHMDAQAQAHGYDNLLSAISYADEPAVAIYQAQGRAFRAWRSLVWARCHELLAEVQAGTLAVPTTPELLGMLPEVTL